MRHFKKNGIIGGVVYSSPLTYEMELKTLSDGSTWARILHHNNKSGTYFFTKDNADNIQTENLYSRMNLLENFRNKDGGFEFLVLQPEFGDKKYRWKQSNNPTNTTTCTDYVNIENGEGGLVSNPCTLCAVSTSGNNWWCAVGSWNSFNSGVPGFGKCTVKESLDFYVRIDNVQFTSCKIYSDKVECSEIIEY